MNSSCARSPTHKYLVLLDFLDFELFLKRLRVFPRRGVGQGFGKREFVDSKGLLSCKISASNFADEILVAQLLFFKSGLTVPGKSNP